MLALQHRKPVFGVDTWAVDEKRSGGAGVTACATPEEAVQKALEAARG